MVENKKTNATPSRRDFLKIGSLATAGVAIGTTVPTKALGAPTREAAAGLEIPSIQPESPSWMADLIVYEIATKGFTSPNGPESGTFNSLRAKLGYLQELGVTCIWLTGYSLCDSHHFYNIWTQYAVIEPDKFDPALGTAAEFKALIDAAHEHGIKVCLDVITHGLMNDSPIIKLHPHWFRGGSWGMTDFDWAGGHTDLDDWWVNIYSNFVTRYRVDGYRLDVSIYRPDLWERIRRNAAASGHSIVIWEEMNSVIPGVTDFTQRENIIRDTDTGKLTAVFENDLPGFYDRKFGRAGRYDVEILYTDCTSTRGSTTGDGELLVRLVGLTTDKVGRRIDDFPPKPDGLPDIQLALENVSRKPIENITIRNDIGDEWQLRTGQSRPMFMEALESSHGLVAEPVRNVYIATLAWGASSIELSCHDNGWTGFPLDKNPYSAQGSRSLFGYSFLFTPMIPIFFSGEEFDATFHAAPGLSPDLYGGSDPGKGCWLYGTMLDWNELDRSRHREMFSDVQKMIAIRKQHPEILGVSPDRLDPNLKAVPHEGNIAVPVPYVRWKDRIAIVVAGNRNKDRDAYLKLSIPLAEIGIGGHGKYRVTDLWSGEAPRMHGETELASFACTVKRDNTGGGGLALFKIEPAR